MAKFTPGPTIGSASGSIGGTVYSRNRYGLYMRTRSIPVNPQSAYQQTQRNHIAQASQFWGGLTDAQRAAWRSWAQNNPITDRLGMSQVLTGHAACVKLNARLLYSENGMISLPPAVAPPDGFTAFALTADLGAGNFEIVFAATPVGANNKYIVSAAVVDSPGQAYFNGLFKQLPASSANATSPYGCQSDIEDRFGTLQVGQKVAVRGLILDTATGLYSAPSLSVATVVSTV